MKISLDTRKVLALISLSFIMQETHEIAHTGIGRLICGCWGFRNFNIWGLCNGCSENPWSVLATYAGPVYTYSIIWAGYYLLSRGSERMKSLGFALIVFSMPFSRVLTPLFGKGDIIFALNGHWQNHTLAWIVGLSIVFALNLPPVIKLWQTIGNSNREWWFVGLLLVPFFAVGAVVFGVLQSGLLNNHILDQYWIMGSPMLVSLWLNVFSLPVSLVLTFHI